MPQHKRGKLESSIWRLFTNKPEPQNLKWIFCKIHRAWVNHHKNLESMKTHLNKCNILRGKMNVLKDEDWPDWYAQNVKPVLIKKSSKLLFTAALSMGQTSIELFTVTGIRRYEKDTFQIHMEIHYYANWMSFQIISNQHLLAEIKVLCPDHNLLPELKNLAGSLL